jgi:hypothetical protein
MINLGEDLEPTDVFSTYPTAEEISQIEAMGYTLA